MEVKLQRGGPMRRESRTDHGRLLCLSDAAYCCMVPATAPYDMLGSLCVARTTLRASRRSVVRRRADSLGESRPHGCYGQADFRPPSPPLPTFSADRPVRARQRGCVNKRPSRGLRLGKRFGRPGSWLKNGGKLERAAAIPITPRPERRSSMTVE